MSEKGIYESTHIYYNVNVANNGSGVLPLSLITSNNQELPVTFNQNRSQPYLYKPQDYFISINRVTVDTLLLPVFIAQPIVGSANVNDTVFSVSLKNSTSGVVSTQQVVWVPQDLTQPTPSTPITKTDITNPYYFCYNISHFLSCVNEAFRLAAIGAGIASNRHPHLQFDPATNLITMYADVRQYRTASDGTSLATVPLNSGLVYMNTELYNLLSSLPSKYVATSLTPQLDYQIILSTGSDVPTATTQPFIENLLTFNNGTTANYVFSVQEYSTISLWSPIKSIIVRGSILNVASNNIATPVVYEGGDININSGKQNTDVLPILVEFTVPLTEGLEYKPTAFWEPQGEYRLSDIYNTTPVYGLQFDMFWKDSFGILHKIILPVGASAYMKILFRKKDFNSDKI